MKKLALLVVASLILGSSLYAQGYKTVPKPLADWYLDTQTMFVTLEKSLSAATDAAATAQALNTASDFAESKKLGPRYKKLKTDYPELFGPDAKTSESWAPPPEWIKTQAEYAKSMKNFGATIQSVMMSYGSDPDVQAAMGRFGAAMESFSDRKGRTQKPVPPTN